MRHIPLYRGGGQLQEMKYRLLDSLSREIVEGGKRRTVVGERKTSMKSKRNFFYLCNSITRFFWVRKVAWERWLLGRKYHLF